MKTLMVYTNIYRMPREHRRRPRAQGRGEILVSSARRELTESAGEFVFREGRDV
jgi:hypothetical protein